METKNVKMELLELIKMQDELIGQQAETILRLVHENAEQENFINEILREQ